MALPAYGAEDNTLPDDFYPHCFEYAHQQSISNSFVVGDIYTLSLSQAQNLVIAQWDQLVPYKKYAQSNSIIAYSNSLGYDFATLTDNNTQTSVEFDTQDAEMILTFDDVIQADSFDFNFEYGYVSWMHADFFVSQDWVSYSEIVYNGPESIEQYNIKKLKIIFSHISGNRDKFDISQLSFTHRYDSYLVAPLNAQNLDIYSVFNCTQWSTPQSTLDVSFPIDINTQTINITLDKNPAYHPQSSLDSDGDGIANANDNCQFIYNPAQTDSNGDTRWDLCSDDDADSIIGHKDNCINIANTNQIDVNQNGVWDVCEFDKDADGIYDALDNCITTPNPDQEDEDRDGIWNSCDNCRYYNPNQSDTNNNSIGDICDTKNTFLLENDNDGDGVENSKDNCPDIANPNQADSDKDWVWDSCDNCLSIQNTFQLDLGNNGVGDMCEDSDADGIAGYKDNCINTSNPDQQDADNNWIWDVCEDNDRDNIIFSQDNCPHIYNPNQQDVDNDSIWDSCDQEDNRYIESNTWFFIALAIFFALIFLWWIYMLLAKLQTK